MSKLNDAIQPLLAQKDAKFDFIVHILKDRSAYMELLVEAKDE